jgi:glucokinase
MNSGKPATTDRVLLADIGGTNARFALMERSEIGPIEHLKVSDFSGAADAIAAFLTRRASGTPEAAVLGVAGVVSNNRCIITNSGWNIDGVDLQNRFEFRTAHLLNDFETVAWSLPALQPSDLFRVEKQRPISGAPMLVVGPGTGFGAACLFPGVPFAATTEAGHTTLPATSEREEHVIDHLRQHFKHVSVERVLSGSGLVNLYHTLAVLDGVAVPDRDPSAITHAALEDGCDVSRAALDMFCSLLGAVAGDLALTFCARGGVYIAGGIVPRFAGHLAKSEFRKQFEGKGRFESYLKSIPTSIIIHPDISFIGLKAFFQQNVAARDRSAVRTMP